MVVMASGQSLTKEDAEAVRHLPRIVTNGTFRMAPDAEIIYGSDALFWHSKHYADVFDCPGLKVSVESNTGIHPNTPKPVLVLRNSGRHGFDARPEYVKTGSNSGYAAIHIAASAGAKRIIVLGLDMFGGHWHGKHPTGLSDPRETSFKRWTKNFETLAPELQKMGIEVINCSPVSRLACFRRASLAESL